MAQSPILVRSCRARSDFFDGVGNLFQFICTERLRTRFRIRFRKLGQLAKLVVHPTQHGQNRQHGIAPRPGCERPPVLKKRAPGPNRWPNADTAAICWLLGTAHGQSLSVSPPLRPRRERLDVGVTNLVRHLCNQASRVACAKLYARGRNYFFNRALCRHRRSRNHFEYCCPPWAHRFSASITAFHTVRRRRLSNNFSDKSGATMRSVPG